MRIGYQGILYSNAYIAAMEYVRKNKIKDYELIPLKNSFNVIQELQEEKIQIGILAFYNSIGKAVEETSNAIKDINIKILDSIKLKIVQTLFKYPGVRIEELKYISSHPQALAQTKETRRRKYPNLIEVEAMDTALAAYQLSVGEISKNTAILSRPEAGEYYQLEMMEYDLSDNPSNETLFHAVAL